MALINTTYLRHYSIMKLQNYILEHIAARLWDLAVVTRKVPDYQVNLISLLRCTMDLAAAPLV